MFDVLFNLIFGQIILAFTNVVTLAVSDGWSLVVDWFAALWGA